MPSPYTQTLRVERCEAYLVSQINAAQRHGCDTVKSLAALSSRPHDRGVPESLYLLPHECQEEEKCYIADRSGVRARSYDLPGYCFS